MRELKGTGGGVDVHWHGGGSGYNHREVLHYDQGQKSPPIKSHQWPFPAFCARATASILSLTWNRRYRGQTIRGDAWEHVTDRWSFDEFKCSGITRDAYRQAIEQVYREKACWIHALAFQTVMCYQFRHCRCPEDQISLCVYEKNIDCCRGAFADFLTEEGLVDQYRGMIRPDHNGWTLQRMFDTWKQATPGPEPGVGAYVRLTGLTGNMSHLRMAGGVIRSIGETGVQVSLSEGEPGCPRRGGNVYKCCAKQVQHELLSVCVRGEDIRGGLFGWGEPACFLVPHEIGGGTGAWEKWSKIEGANRCSSVSPWLEKEQEVWRVIFDQKGEADWIEAARKTHFLMSVKPENVVLETEVYKLTIIPLDSSLGPGTVMCTSTTPLRRVMDKYAKEFGLDASKVSFVYNDKFIRRHSTLKSLGVQDKRAHQGPVPRDWKARLGEMGSLKVANIEAVRKGFKLTPPPTMKETDFEENELEEIEEYGGDDVGGENVGEEEIHEGKA
uniref:Rad60/SUMO-like domain-containing protein n=1 Tax=Zooxanthella nutricula TaxID=1333877 RepID=A0A7S2QG57_9DINO